MLAELGQKLSAVRYLPNSYLSGPDWLCLSLGEYIVFVIVAELFVDRKNVTSFMRWGDWRVGTSSFTKGEIFSVEKSQHF